MSILEAYPDLQRYERIHHRKRKPTDKLTVTIYKHSGSVNLSETAYNALGCPNWLVLFYSQAKHALLLQSASETDPGAMKVAKRGRTATYFVNVKQLCRHMGIDIANYHRYEAELQDDVLVVDLGKEDDRAS